MDKSELLAELNGIFLDKTNERLADSRGSLTNSYEISGILERANNVSEQHEITFIVYNEGEIGETAHYVGDPLTHIFKMKILDYINITNDWIGYIYRAIRPRAICRIIQDPAVGEKWFLITETAPATYSVEEIAGTILT